MEQTYRVPVQNVAQLEAQLTTLAKRAAKLGQTLTWQVGEVEITGKNADTGELYAIRSVTVCGTTPALAGWTFVAIIQAGPEDTGNILRCVPGESVPADYRTSEQFCDHCKQSRRRIDTYIVRHTNGEHKQVGSSCLGDFVGAGDPHALAAYAELLCQARDLAEVSEDDFMGGGGRGSNLIGLEDFLTITCSVVRVSGWLSRGKARDSFGQIATADIVLDYWNDHGKTPALRKYNGIPADGELAKLIITFCREVLADDSDFEHNLKVATASDALDLRWSGIAAAGYICYTMYCKKQAERAQTANSEYVGTIGKRQAFAGLTCVHTQSFDSMYGVSHLHIFTDTSGNKLCWFSSSARLDKGSTYGGKATVKAHEIRDGQKQTMLTRCSFDKEG